LRRERGERRKGVLNGGALVVALLYSVVTGFLVFVFVFKETVLTKILV
jgi:hypothetical protein